MTTVGILINAENRLSDLELILYLNHDTMTFVGWKEFFVDFTEEFL